MDKKAFLLPLVLNQMIACSHENVSFLYAHSLGDKNTAVYRYTTKNKEGLEKTHGLINNNSVFTFDFPDVTRYPWRIDFTHINLAQHNDIICLHKAYEDAIMQLNKENRPNDIALMGTCRGASAIINFMAIFNPKNVHVLILESPFDDVKTVIKHKISQLLFVDIPVIVNLCTYVTETICMQYRAEGISPIDVASDISAQVPMLFVCSKNDSIVPYHSTVNLYNAIKKTGNKDLYLLVLDQGDHAFLLSGPDGDKYAQVAHAFFKKYNMPYNSELAVLGKNLLEECHLF